jgi:signal transduction histidine kinase/CheY-like chemotaxis protein/HPt (histidine-containing phosphotransfer) domain-containing protein
LLGAEQVAGASTIMGTDDRPVAHFLPYRSELSRFLRLFDPKSSIPAGTNLAVRCIVRAMNASMPFEAGEQHAVWHNSGSHNSDSMVQGRRFALLLLCAGAFVFFAAWGGIELTRQGDRVASLWLANAGALAFVLRRHDAGGFATLAVIFVANTAANLMTGDTLALAVGLAICNLIEICLAAALLLRGNNLLASLGESGGLVRLIVFAAICAPMFSALCAATLLAVGSGMDFETVAWRWFLADCLGMVTLAPLLFTLRISSVQELLRASTVFELVALAAIAVTVSAIIFSQPHYPILFMIFPVLTFIAFRVRFVGTALAVTLVAAIATVLTIRGEGPIAAAIPGMVERVTFLQVFLAVATLSTLPIASVLHERSKLQRELLLATQDAHEAAKAKSNFLATMSHEIRTPMTGVLGMIELLRSNPGETDRNRFFSSLEQSANLLMTVLDDILDYSKIETGKLTFEDIEFDLRHLARATLDLFHGTSSAKGLVLDLHFTSQFTAVRGDPVRLQQVMGNLISNAIEFTDVGRIELWIDARLLEDDLVAVSFAVSDTGIGISPDLVGRLFSPFVQAEASTNRRFGGTGLGLAICRRIVESLGGKLTVDSIPGLGSTFSYTIALKRGDPSAVRQSAAVRIGPQRSLSVLLAEDNPVNRMLVSTLVQRMGHTVETAANGLLAVEAVAAKRFDVILMDMQMPELDGIAATRAIRATATGASVPIIALTADASPDRRRFYDNVGLSGFLTKPVDSALLRERLDAVAANLPDDDVARLVLLDEDRLGELGEAIGASKVDELLDILLDDLTERHPRIVALAETGATTALKAELHALRGATASIGAVRLTAAIEAMDEARDPADAVAAVPAFSRAAQATQVEIASRKSIGRRKLG